MYQGLNLKERGAVPTGQVLVGDGRVSIHTLCFTTPHNACGE